jgi:hypothetical protein
MPFRSGLAYLTRRKRSDIGLQVLIQAPSPAPSTAARRKRKRTKTDTEGTQKKSKLTAIPMQPPNGLAELDEPHVHTSCHAKVQHNHVAAGPVNHVDVLDTGLPRLVEVGPAQLETNNLIEIRIGNHDLKPSAVVVGDTNLPARWASSQVAVSDHVKLTL